MIRITVDSKTSPSIQNLIDSLGEEKRKAINRQAGAAALNIIKLYHKAFNDQGKWNGGRYLGNHPGGSGPFGASVTAAWHLASVDTNGVVIGNNLSSYAFKVNGRTIVPKRGKFLTIPLIREARGIRARAYSQNTGHDLFRPRGKGGSFKNVLAEKVEGGTLRNRRSARSMRWCEA